MSNTPERDEQLLAIGHQCSLPSCLLVDFLPFKCQHCNERFCAEHFTVDGHKCPKYDEGKYNRVAPPCPLCNEPVSIRAGEDPNIQMEHHISTECSVMTGKLKAKSAPVCAKGKCGKVLFAPIRCDKCKLQFCPAHRFPNDHTCSSLESKRAQSKPSAPKASTSKPTIHLTTKATVAGNATMDAIRKTITSTTGPNSTKQPLSNPFSSKNPDRSSPSSPASLSPLSTPPSSPIVAPLKRTPSPSTSLSLFDPMAFIPRPIFASA